MVNNNSYTYLSAFCLTITVAAAIIHKFLLPGQKIPVAYRLKPWCGYTIARCKGPVPYPSCHARMKKSITLFHIMSCMLYYFHAACGSHAAIRWVTSVRIVLWVSGLNKGMQVAMIPALISKGMQAMHHDRSINQTFFEESKCNNRSSKEAKN